MLVESIKLITLNIITFLRRLFSRYITPSFRRWRCVRLFFSQYSGHFFIYMPHLVEIHSFVAETQLFFLTNLPWPAWNTFWSDQSFLGRLKLGSRVLKFFVKCLSLGSPFLDLSSCLTMYPLFLPRSDLSNLRTSTQDSLILT